MKQASREAATSPPLRGSQPHLAIQPPQYPRPPSFERPCRYLYNRVLRRGFSNLRLPWSPSTQKILQKFEITHRRQDGDIRCAFGYWRVGNSREPLPPIPQQKEVIP